MKKLILFTSMCFAMLIPVVAQVTDSTATVVYTFGDSLMEFLKSNMWTLIFAVLYFVSEYLGETDKVKEGSIWRKLLNWALEFAKKKGTISAKMKRFTKVILLGIVLSGAGLYANAQSHWDGFWKPVKNNVQINDKLFKADTTENNKAIWLFRPSVALSAVAFDFSESDPISKSLTSAGLGLSYGKFSVVNEKAYCNYSVNAFVLTTLKIGDETNTNLGGALTMDVFNKLIGAGFGAYMSSGKFHPMLLTTISYSF